MSTTPSEPPVPVGVARRTSPLTVGLELAGVAFAVAVGLAIAASGNWAEASQSVLAVLVLLARAAGWWFRTYTLEPFELVLDEGILQRRHRVVPYNRIQQVEVRQKLLHRLFRLAAVEVETAAEAGSTAVSLRLLDEATARHLRAFLLGAQRRVRREGVDVEAPYTDAPAPSGVALLRFGVGELALAGATGPAAVGIAVGGLTPAIWVGAVVTASGDASALGGAGVAGLIVMLFAAFALVVGVAGQIGRDYAYELGVVGDDIHLRHGLFELREHTLPRARVQQIRVLDNPLRRLLGSVSVVLHSAASPGGNEGASNIVTVPLLPRAQIDEFLVALMGDPAWATPSLVPRSPPARRRAIVRRAVLVGLVVSGPVVLWWPGGVVLLPAVALAWPWGLAAHRLAGYQFSGPVAAVASGVVLRRTDLVPRRRVQSGRTRSSYFQRRVGLASLYLDVAGTRRVGPLRESPGLYDMDADVAAARARTVPAR